MRYGPDQAECLVYTFKEGLLSAIAHDLEIRVTSFTVDIGDAAGAGPDAGAPAGGANRDGDRPHSGTAGAGDVAAAGEAPRRASPIEARFDAGSLRVVTAMASGHPHPALSAQDRREIEKTIAAEVLQAGRFPEVRFTGSVAGAGDEREVRGRLSLHGRQRDLVLAAHRSGGRWRIEAKLHQPDWGIRPYSAMLGTLKLRPDVIVRLSLPAAAG